MILAALSDPILELALRRAASPDEDVFCDEDRVLDALERGFPRLIVQGALPRGSLRWIADRRAQVPVFHITREVLAGWEERRGRLEVAPSRVRFWQKRLGEVIRQDAGRVSWIDRTFSDLAGAAGAHLPPALKGLGRRVMEYPSLYTTLGPVARATGFSSGSLKARFRRRRLASPSVYLRWFRAFAVVHVLTEGGLPYREAAFRLGFSGSANLCRFLENATARTAGRLTGSGGREAMLSGFVGTLLRAGDLAGWRDLDGVFLRRVA